MTEGRTHVGRYQIQRVLGRGAMGVVYEGRDPELGRSVALKAIDLHLVGSDTERATFVERFLTEARAAAGLSHANIVVVYDIGRDEAGMPFIALEHLQGQTLERMLADGGPVDWRTALGIVRKLAEALHHAHLGGVIHRDVKPANVMILPSGEPKLMDFGIAKVVTAQLTASGQIFGSPSYMSPEQAGGLPLDARSDVFSLGSVLYEMLTGTRAFPGPSAPKILLKVMKEDPPPPSTRVSSLPLGLDALVAGALAKDPAERLPDAESFARDVGEVLEGRPPQFRPPAPVTAPPVEATETPFEATVRAGFASIALPAGKRFSLAAIDGPCQGRTYPVEKTRVTIGRSGAGANADIRLDDPEISRRHAVLTWEGSGFELRDLGSTNGTLVDGRRIESCRLEDKGEFSVGRSRLMLVIVEAD